MPKGVEPPKVDDTRPAVNPLVYQTERIETPRAGRGEPQGVVDAAVGISHLNPAQEHQTNTPAHVRFNELPVDPDLPASDSAPHVGISATARACRSSRRSRG